MAIFAGGPPNLQGIKYFDFLLCHNYFLTKPNICAKFESEIGDLSCRVRVRVTSCLVLPGVLMDTLLKKRLKFYMHETNTKTHKNFSYKPPIFLLTNRIYTHVHFPTY